MLCSNVITVCLTEALLINCAFFITFTGSQKGDDAKSDCVPTYLPTNSCLDTDVESLPSVSALLYYFVLDYQDNFYDYCILFRIMLSRFLL